MYDVVTVGDAMRDIFVFPAHEEMQKPVFGSVINQPADEKFLVLGYGDKITVSDVHHDIGGSACNVASGLAKLGIKTGIISAVGNDNDGLMVLKKLKDMGVETNKVKIRSDKKTSFSVIISYKGERSILVFHSFKPTDFQIPDNLNTNWIYVGPLGKDYRQLYLRLTSLAAEKGVKIALNPGSVQINDGLLAFGALLRVTKILFINKEEGKQLAGISGVARPEEIIKALKKTGVETVVLTDGKNGSYASLEDEIVKCSIYPGERIESTGAGDSFASAFVAATIRGKNLVESLQWGSVNSASVVNHIGAQDGLLTAATIDRRAKAYHW